MSIVQKVQQAGRVVKPWVLFHCLALLAAYVFVNVHFKNGAGDIKHFAKKQAQGAAGRNVFN